MKLPYILAAGLPFLAMVSAANTVSEATDGLPSTTADPSFVAAFVTSLSVIIVSEIGDKTFFIAAIMAMRHNRWQVFTGAIGALALMTVLSAGMGYALPNLISKFYTHYAACLLFLVFGVRLLREYLESEGDGASEELEEVENELEKKESSRVDLEAGPAAKSKGNILNRFFSAIFLQAFSMTFLAEWGDRSQIATIALAAARNPVGVTLGGILGHALCTGGAVLGGRMLSARISARNVNLCGGLLFLLFALSGFYFGPEDI